MAYINTITNDQGDGKKSTLKILKLINVFFSLIKHKKFSISIWIQTKKFK